MGAGEQKLVRLIRHLESIPQRSLILLEEPELTLHPDAQFGLAWYLMTLAKRRGHQIIIATHSSSIFEALPQAARIVLTRDGGPTPIVLHNVSKLAAARELSSSIRANKTLLFVEDEVAKKFMAQLIDRFGPGLRDTTTVVDVGSSDDVRRMVERLRGQGVHVAGVRDPDVGENASAHLFCLPGDLCPEEVLLHPDNVERAEGLYAGFRTAYEQAAVQGNGYVGSERAKRVMRALPRELGQSADFVSDRIALAWLSNPDNQVVARALVDRVREALEAD